MVTVKKILMSKAGINYNFAEKLFALSGISKNNKKNLKINFPQEVLARQLLLFKKLQSKILFLKAVQIRNKTYKGIRYEKGFPVRGQRTHTNAQTTKKIFNKWKN